VCAILNKHVRQHGNLSIGWITFNYLTALNSLSCLTVVFVSTKSVSVFGI